MNDNERTFELMTKMYAEMQDGFKNIHVEIKEIKSDVSELTDQVGMLTNKVTEIDKDLKEVKKTVIKIEDDHGKKLSALFDGYKQLDYLDWYKHLKQNAEIGMKWLNI